MSIGILSLTSGVTLAAYSRKTRVDQNVSVANKKGTNIYLDAAEWDKDGALFFMYVWNSSDGTVVKKYLRPIGKTSEGYYIYSFQSTVHDKLLFLRANPDYASTNANAFDDEPSGTSGRAFVSGIGWNKTDDFSYSTISSTTLCTITNAWSSFPFIGSDSNTLGTISQTSWTTYSY